MKKIFTSFLIVLSTVLMLPGAPVMASSHREAPLITEFPKSDGTDFYIFNSYEAGRSDFVTLIANYIPLQDGYGGPNFFSLDPDALYEIHIDNNGDAREDITFQFMAVNNLNDIALDVGGEMVSVPFITVGGIGPGRGDNMSTNVIETFTARVIRGNRRTGMAGTIVDADSGQSVFVKPTDNIGNKTIASYETYARNHIYNVNIPGCSTPGKIFVGQRKEPFYLDLGGVFDLVNYNPLGPETGGENQIEDKNVTTFAVELPKSCATGSSSVIGAWTTSSLPASRLKGNRALTLQGASSMGGMSGGFVQVSRLSAPLVNELVIGLKDKDKFNGSEPKDDGQFATYVTNPTLPAILEILFGAGGYKAPTLFPRTDLVAAFLTGVEGLNKNTAVAEMMRLNTSIAAVPAAQQNRLGVIGGDTAGFPNGRRPGDDVVDIALRVVSGVLITDPAQAPAGMLALTDGVAKTATDFDQVFPYIKSPLPGKVTPPVVP